MKPDTNTFERRTVIVLASLIISMTAVSGLLLLLEPMPLAPSGGAILTVLDTDTRGTDPIFSTRPAPDTERWRAVVIQHSGESHGSARTLAEKHQAQGRAGLDHHFVIGNGDGAEDGEIQVGYRWSRQMGGRHAQGLDEADWYDRHAVSICLIGDGEKRSPTRAQMDQLVWLVTALQSRLRIPADHVLHRDNLTAEGPGMLFPAGSFRQQLLRIDPRRVDAR